MMRAAYPEREGFVEREGVRVHYEVYGTGPETILFVGPWSIVHSRVWKMQIPYFARHYRVVTFDARGNGHNDRPETTEAYAEDELAADALAVLDATDTARAVVVTFSMGANRSLLLAHQHPERVRALVFIGGLYSETDRSAFLEHFTAEHERYEGWQKMNMHAFRQDYEDFVRFFFDRMFPEPHSTKQREDGVGWGLETDAETLIKTVLAPKLEADRARRVAESIQCPVLVIHGSQDEIVSQKSGEALAARTGGELVVLEGCGHAPLARDPVKVNLLLRDFIDGGRRRRTPRWTRGRSRRRRALFVSSPIGLGHAQRDLAVARALRELVPDLEVQWLAQSPVTKVLEAEGEQIHPASKHLANESSHLTSESCEHELHCFRAWRRMDEILLNNFMVFHDVVNDEPFDLWVGDEAWELDYYLHENPEEKRAAYAWLTDFVGWLPMPEGGEREAELTADYNAEMIEHIAHHKRVRDRAIFVGNPDDIVDASFGKDLPMIRDWTEANFDFAGYVTGFDPGTLGERDKLRAELGYAPNETVCIATVGGSGVGTHLLERVIAAFEPAKKRIDNLRMVVVAGPRIDPARFEPRAGLEVRPYVHNLYRHLAACDIALVQGGLTTSMELAANKRPFLYFPLKNHFEQNFHVHHRLQRYRAGRRMDIDHAGPADIARAMSEELTRRLDYRDVETDGAQRAAALLAELL